MVHFYALKITSSDIACAVMVALVHDHIVNSLGMDGFPQVKVSRKSAGSFAVELSFEGEADSFDLSEGEAKAAVNKLKKDKIHYQPIFDRIQNSVAVLGGKLTGTKFK